MKKRKSVLVADSEAWTRAGDELRRLDPRRYVAILSVVEDICRIHRNPLGADVADGFLVFPEHRNRDPD